MAKYLDTESLDFDKAHKLYKDKEYYELVKYLKAFAKQKRRTIYLVEEFLATLRAIKIKTVATTTVFDVYRRKHLELTSREKRKKLKSLRGDNRNEISDAEKDVKESFIDWFMICGGTKKMVEKFYAKNGRYHGFEDDLEAFEKGKKFYFSQSKTKSGFGGFTYHKYVTDSEIVGAVCSAYCENETVKVSIVSRDGKTEMVVKIPTLKEIEIKS